MAPKGQCYTQSYLGIHNPTLVYTILPLSLVQEKIFKLFSKPLVLFQLFGVPKSFRMFSKLYGSLI